MTALTPVSFRKPREHEPRLSKPYVPGRHSDRFWTEDEDALLRRHFPVGGAPQAEVHLPKRTRGSIYQRAAKLGLQPPGAADRAPRHRTEITPELDARIAEEWSGDAGKGAVAALAERLGLSRHALYSRAAKLGLIVPHQKEPPWTAAEEALLERIPLHNPKWAASIFREHGFARSPTAIMIRAKRRQISRRYRETLSATGAARILGVDNKWVTARCIAGDLVATKRETARLPQQGGDPWSIERADLRRYVIEQIAQVDIRKVDKFEFVALLTETGEQAPAAAPPPAAGADHDDAQPAEPAGPEPVDPPQAAVADDHHDDGPLEVAGAIARLQRAGRHVTPEGDGYRVDGKRCSWAGLLTRAATIR
ncbi:MAG: hypothetical protein AB7O45_10190 [Alphaproteobacteria bacterium]